MTKVPLSKDDYEFLMNLLDEAEEQTQKFE
jgi:hypothetical protein